MTRKHSAGTNSNMHPLPSKSACTDNQSTRAWEGLTRKLKVSPRLFLSGFRLPYRRWANGSAASDEVDRVSNPAAKPVEPRRWKNPRRDEGGSDISLSYRILDDRATPCLRDHRLNCRLRQPIVVASRRYTPLPLDDHLVDGASNPA